MNWLTNNSLNWSKEWIKAGGSCMYQAWAGPFRVYGKALHFIASEILCNNKSTSKVSIWFVGPPIPSYLSIWVGYLETIRERFIHDILSEWRRSCLIYHLSKPCLLNSLGGWTPCHSWRHIWTSLLIFASSCVSSVEQAVRLLWWYFDLCGCLGSLSRSCNFSWPVDGYFGFIHTNLDCHDFDWFLVEDLLGLDVRNVYCMVHYECERVLLGC